MKDVTSTISRTKQKVKGYLEKQFMYRDDDYKLIARFWRDEIVEKNKNPLTFSSYDFFVLYSSGALTSGEIISRARRRLQEELPALRGSKWMERHSEEKNVRNNINPRF